MRILLLAAYHRPDKLRASLASIPEDEVDAVALINNSPCSEIREIVKENQERFLIKYFPYERNFGKIGGVSKVINELSLLPEDCICIGDDDIIYKKGVLDHLFKCALATEAIVTPEHDGNRAHRYNEETGHYLVDDIYHVPRGSYVAEACMTMLYSTFKKLGGFDKDISLYGGDGPVLFSKTHKAGVKVCVAREHKVFHPFEDDDEYQRWKDSIHQKIAAYGKGAEVGFYESKLETQEVKFSKIVNDILEELKLKPKEICYNPCGKGIAYVITTSPIHDEYRDENCDFLSAAYSQLQEGSAIVVLNTLPKTEAQQSLFRHKGNWTGKAWKAILELRKKNNCRVITFQEEGGITVIEKSDGEMPVPNTLEFQVNASYHDYVKNAGEYLNISPLEILLGKEKVKEKKKVKK